MTAPGRPGRRPFAAASFLSAVLSLVPAFLGACRDSPDDSSRGDSSSEESPLRPSATALAATAVQIRGAGSRLVVPAAASLMPGPEEEDFFVVTWVRLRSLPEPGARAVFLSDVDVASPARSGFGLAFSRDGDEVRPEIYFRDRTGTGGWHTFPGVFLNPGDWTMLGMSLRRGRLLGLHVRLPSGDDFTPPTLLGGYEFAGQPLVPPGSDLFVGSTDQGEFVGTIGTVMIARGPDFTSRLSEVWAAVPPGAATPPNVPGLSVGLFLVAGKDLGPAGHRVGAVRVVRPQ